MVGVCGVAPKPGLDVHCAVPGDHGSNLDTKMIKVGSRVYLPVAVPGAGLAVGDDVIVTPRPVAALAC